MKPADPDSALSRTLADWRLTPPRDPAFRTAVWSRIAATRRPATWPAFARAHVAALAGALVLAIVAGAWAGKAEARTRVAASRDAIARSYVQSLDARVMRLP
jgi:hypothetical protein